VESKPAKDGKYYIRGIKFKLQLGGGVFWSWYVEEAIETRCQPIAARTGIHYPGNRVAIDYGILPYLANLSQFTYSVWVKRLSSTSFAPLFSRSVDLGTGRRGNFLIINSAGTLHFESYKTPTDGEWEATAAVTTLNQWVHVLLEYDNTTDTANPVMYVDNVSATVTETQTPSGTSDDDSDCPLVFFNLSPDPLAPEQKYYYSTIYNIAIKDARIYNRILSSSERAALTAGEDDYTTVPNGLLFQGPYAPTANISDYINDTIENDDLVLDAVYRACGIPYNEDTTSSDEMLYGLAL
jgi:hypothetical protein